MKTNYARSKQEINWRNKVTNELWDIRMSVRLSQMRQTEKGRVAVTASVAPARPGASPVRLKHGSLGRALTCKPRSWTNTILFFGMIDDQRRKIRREIAAAGDPPPLRPSHHLLLLMGGLEPNPVPTGWALDQLQESTERGSACDLCTWGPRPSGGLQMKPYCCEATVLAAAPPCCSAHSRQINPDPGLSSSLRCNGVRGSYFSSFCFQGAQ